MARSRFPLNDPMKADRLVTLGMGVIFISFGTLFLGAEAAPLSMRLTLFFLLGGVGVLLLCGYAQHRKLFKSLCDWDEAQWVRFMREEELAALRFNSQGEVFRHSFRKVPWNIRELFFIYALPMFRTPSESLVMRGFGTGMLFAFGGCFLFRILNLKIFDGPQWMFSLCFVGFFCLIWCILPLSRAFWKTRRLVCLLESAPICPGRIRKSSQSGAFVQFLSADGTPCWTRRGEEFLENRKDGKLATVLLNVRDPRKSEVLDALLCQYGIEFTESGTWKVPSLRPFRIAFGVSLIAGSILFYALLMF